MIRSLAGERVSFPFSGRDMGFALRLLRETTVWKARLDRALSAFCSTPIEELDRIVAAALRVGAAQLLILKTPPHAAVSATVEAIGGHRARGLVNAVLRRLAKEGEPGQDEMPVSVFWSHPEELVQRWTARYGESRTLELLEWNNSVPTIGGCSAEDPEGSVAGRWLGEYVTMPRTGGPPLESSARGIYIQDEASALVASAAAGLCDQCNALEIGAAPGGKTHHLHRKARTVISVDIDPSRMGRWMENRRRLDWANTFPVVADGRFIPTSRLFDLVFLDAPCTNTGVYRRRFDARWKWSAEYLEEMAGLQESLLRSAGQLVERDGILIYSTCSLEEEENSLQVEVFEKSNPHFRRMSFDLDPELVRNGMICIFPPEHGMDGLFAAAWRREA